MNNRICILIIGILILYIYFRKTPIIEGNKKKKKKKKKKKQENDIKNVLAGTKSSCEIEDSPVYTHINHIKKPSKMHMGKTSGRFNKNMQGLDAYTDVLINGKSKATLKNKYLGGQFFTPREIIKVIIETIKPKIGKTIFDPCCGTGGFFIEAFKYLSNKKIKPSEIEFLKSKTFWGKEQEDDAILMLLANLVLHNISSPKIWHGNTLTGTIDNNELFLNAPQTYDYIFTNPPFGSKEGKAAQAKFPYKCGKAQILFIQEIIDNLKDGGECGMVIDEGVMFHSKTKAFLQTKKKLLNENNLHTIISLPPGVFVNANAASKTNLLFFKKGSPTKKIWYYDMAITEEFLARKVNKGNPLLFEHFNDFFIRYNLSNNDPKKTSERSWFVDLVEIKKTNYKIHAQNNNKPDLSDKRTSKQIYESISKNLKELNDLVKNLN